MSQLDPSDFRFQRAVLEIRYPKAHKYWDESGKLVETIESRLPGLTCEELRPDGFRFVGDGVGVSSATFYWDKTLFLQGESDPATKFGTTVQEFWRLVAQHFAVTAPNRVGHRTWYILPVDDESSATAWLNERSAWLLRPELASQLGTPIANGATLRSVLQQAGRYLRIELDVAGLRAPESKPVRGVVLDVDISAIDPRAAALGVVDYIRWNYRFIEQNRASLFERE